MGKTNKQITIDLFNQFLRENNIASKYYVNGAIATNIRNCSFKTVSGFLKSKKNKPSEYVGCLFYWHKTIEGHEHWSKINKKWLARLNSLRF